MGNSDTTRIANSYQEFHNEPSLRSLGNGLYVIKTTPTCYRDPRGMFLRRSDDKSGRRTTNLYCLIAGGMGVRIERTLTTQHDCEIAQQALHGREIVQDNVRNVTPQHQLAGLSLTQSFEDLEPFFGNFDSVEDYGDWDIMGSANKFSNSIDGLGSNIRRIGSSLERYNEIVKTTNSLFSPVVDILNLYSKHPWAKQTARFTRRVGLVNISVDVYLAVDAFMNRQWLEGIGHTYNTGIGVVGQLGPIGSAAATSVNSYVEAGNYIIRLVGWINTTGERLMLNRIIRGHGGHGWR